MLAQSRITRVLDCLPQIWYSRGLTKWQRAMRISSGGGRPGQGRCWRRLILVSKGSANAEQARSDDARHQRRSTYKGSAKKMFAHRFPLSCPGGRWCGRSNSVRQHSRDEDCDLQFRVFHDYSSPNVRALLE